MSEWIKFKLIKYKDKKGGGTIYPVIAQEWNRHLRLNWHEKGDDLLLEVDCSSADADAIVTQQTEFKAKRVLDKDAETMKIDVFNISTKSGETVPPTP